MAKIQPIRGTIAPPLAQQIFTIGSAAAGAVGGMLLAKEFAGKPEVRTSHVVGATLISGIITFGAAMYLGKMAGKEQYY